MKINRKSFGLAGIAALSVAAYAFQSSHQLVVDGNVVSNNMVLENGKYMVPVKDVAKFFGYKFNVVAGTGELAKSDAINSNDLSPATSATSDRAQTLQVPAPTAPLASDLTPPPPLPAGSTAAVGAMPTTVIPGTAVTTATENLFPDTAKPADKVSTSVGNPVTTNGFTYKIDSIQDGGERYRETNDQRQTTVHPAWKTDKLALINISITNSGSSDANVYAPGPGDITVFDNQKLGFPPVAVDIRQSPDSFNTSGEYDLAGYSNSSDLMLAAGGTLHYVVVASIPKNEQITSLLINVPGNGTNGPGAAITVTR